MTAMTFTEAVDYRKKKDQEAYQRLVSNTNDAIREQFLGDNTVFVKIHDETPIKDIHNLIDLFKNAGWKVNFRVTPRSGNGECMDYGRTKSFSSRWGCCIRWARKRGGTGASPFHRAQTNSS